MSALEDAIHATRLYSDGVRYVLLKLSPRSLSSMSTMLMSVGRLASFCALIADRHEVTVVIGEDALKALEGYLSDAEVSEPRFRLITFVAVFDFDVVGFMARVSGALAAAGVPLFPYAAYSTDHLLVPEAHVETAMRVLRDMGMKDE